MVLDVLLLAAGVGGLIWVATRWDEFDRSERLGNLFLLSGLALTGGVDVAGLTGTADLVGQALAAVLAAVGFYLLVVRGSGVPRAAAESDPADVPDEWDAEAAAAESGVDTDPDPDADATHDDESRGSR